jgi:hypothetical protein
MNWLLTLLMLKTRLTYITLSHIQIKKKKKLLTFQHEFFNLDPRVHIKMNRLKTIAI